MNRHERRAAEARARSAAGRDKDFEAYQAMYRHAFHVVSERDIGEGYMRGEVAKINGVEQVVIHPLGGSPTPATETDIHLSARYRSSASLRGCSTSIFGRWSISGQISS